MYDGTLGTAGSAYSSLTKTSATSSSLRLTTRATGGTGSSRISSSGTAGNGADGTAISSATNSAGTAETHAIANGGAGGWGLSGANGGTGCNAYSTATSSTSSDNYSVSVNGTAYGGSGGIVDRAGPARTAGSGGSAVSSSTGTATVNNWVYVSDYAAGGDGGPVWSGIPGSGGAGGTATSTAYGSNAGSLSVGVYANALGGDGGIASSGYLDGVPGNAMAMAEGVGGGNVDVYSTAISGIGRSSGFGTSTATATGTSGQATADATSYHQGMVNYLNARAIAPVSSTVVAESRSAIDLTAVDAPHDLNAATYAMGQPHGADLTSTLAGNPWVNSNFDMGGTSDIFLLATMSGCYPDEGSPTSKTFSSFIDMDVDMSELTEQALLVGLMNPEYGVDGFDSLQFRIKQEDSLVYDTIFTDLSSALSFFNDNTLNLGDWSSGLTGDLDLSFYFDLTTDDLGEGFRFDFIAGNSTIGSGPPVPIPSAVWLLGSGLIAIVGVRRKFKK